MLGSKQSGRRDAQQKSGHLSDHALRALTSAQGLAVEGRWREAIETLTQANRSQRDPAIERQLVRLRHQAFEQLDWPSPPPWPPKKARGAPPGSPPEVTFDDLSANVLTSSILQAGCLLVRGLIPRPGVKRLIDTIELAFAAFDSVRGNKAARDAVPWFERFDPPAPHYSWQLGYGRSWIRDCCGVMAADSPPALFDLLETVEATGAFHLVASHLGEQPALLVEKTTLRRVTRDSDCQWHQDGAFLGADIRTLNIWLALTRCGHDAPGLDILPRRLDHLVPTGTPGTHFDWATSPAIVDDVADGVQICRPVFEPGDALLFDHFLLHRTVASREMTSDRYGVEMWFFAPSLHPRSRPPLVV